MAGQVSAMLHLLQMVHLRCSQLFLSKFRALASSHSWSFPHCRNTVTPCSDSSDMYTSTVQCGLPSANAALLPHFRLQTFYPPSAHFIFSFSAASHHPLLLAVFLRLLLPLPPDSLRVLKWNAGGLRARSLNYFTFSQPTLLILSASRNPILTHIPLSRFLDSLLCALIVPTPDLAFSLLMPRTLAAALSFSSGRAYPFLNFLPPLFLRVIPTLIM